MTNDRRNSVKLLLTARPGLDTILKVHITDLEA
jgi:hypothetical protein